MADQQTNMDLFNHSLMKLFKEIWHPDVRFLAGDDDHQDPIPAHKIIMVNKFQLFVVYL